MSLSIIIDCPVELHARINSPAAMAHLRAELATAWAAQLAPRCEPASPVPAPFHSTGQAGQHLRCEWAREIITTTERAWEGA